MEIPPSILRGSSSHGRHVLSARFMSTVCDRLQLPLTDGLIPATYFIFVTRGNTVRKGSGLT